MSRAGQAEPHESLFHPRKGIGPVARLLVFLSEPTPEMKFYRTIALPPESGQPYGNSQPMTGIRDGCLAAGHWHVSSCCLEPGVQRLLKYISSP